MSIVSVVPAKEKQEPRVQKIIDIATDFYGIREEQLRDIRTRGKGAEISKIRLLIANKFGSIDTCILNLLVY